MKYLFLSPHQDDVELACGGTIARYISEGHEVVIVVFSDCGLSREEITKAHEKLGVTQTHILDFRVRIFPQDRQAVLDTCIVLRDEIKPDVVFIPDPKFDIHQDHKTVGIEAIRAFKQSCSIIAYSHPHNQFGTNHTYYVKLNTSHLKLKMAALRCYVSQKARPYFTDEYFFTTARYYGMQSWFGYAEAFRIVRMVA